MLAEGPGWKSTLAVIGVALALPSVGSNPAAPAMAGTVVSTDLAVAAVAEHL